MENTQSIKSYRLNSQSFEKHPIWTWDENIAFGEDENWVCPVNEADILDGDYDTLFIKSNFVTKGNRKLSGYIIYDGVDVFVIGIFVENDKLIFNKRLKDISDKQLQKLKQVLEIEGEEIFPIYYNAVLTFEDNQHIEGFFDINNKSQ